MPIWENMCIDPGMIFIYNEQVKSSINKQTALFLHQQRGFFHFGRNNGQSMNIAARYNLLPDLARNFHQAQPTVIYPLSRPEASPDTPIKTGDESPQGQANTYKYYVLSDTLNVVYTREKSTEKLFAQDKGSLVNLYV